MKKVNVILPIYNGEKYIRELMDSLISQTYKNIDVYIRDDGSTDSTISIVKEYVNKTFDGIKFIYFEDDCGNLRTAKGIHKIIQYSEDADYYAFCDQDDIWMPDKIERAVNSIEEYSQDECVLYSAAYEICDASLNRISKSRKTVPFDEMSIGKSFFNYGPGLGLGFTLVFNKTLCKKAFVSGYEDIRAQDVWIWAVTIGSKGKYIYDSEYECAKYRRHEGTVTVSGKGALSLWLWRFKALSDKRYLDKFVSGLFTFYDLFHGSDFGDEDRKFLEAFGHREFRGKKRFKKFFYPYRLKKSIPEELATRMMFLLGKV